MDGQPVFERRKIDNVPSIIAYKWSPVVVDEGFIPFPKRLLRCLSDLFPDPRDLQVVLAAVDYARPNLSRPPSYDYLAFNAGMSVPEYKQRITDMQTRGYLMAVGPDEAIKIKLDGLMDKIERLTNETSDKKEAKGVGQAPHPF
jgi:hypothetical protein